MHSERRAMTIPKPSTRAGSNDMGISWLSGFRTVSRFPRLFLFLSLRLRKGKQNVECLTPSGEVINMEKKHLHILHPVGTQTSRLPHSLLEVINMEQENPHRSLSGYKQLWHRLNQTHSEQGNKNVGGRVIQNDGAAMLDSTQNKHDKHMCASENSRRKE